MDLINEIIRSLIGLKFSTDKISAFKNLKLYISIWGGSINKYKKYFRDKHISWQWTT